MKDIEHFFFCIPLKQLRAKSTGCLKKLSFTKLSFWRSCFQKGRNIYDICDKSGNAQFGKTQFLDTLYILILLWRESHYSPYLRPT